MEPTSKTADRIIERFLALPAEEKHEFLILLVRAMESSGILSPEDLGRLKSLTDDGRHMKGGT